MSKYKYTESEQETFKVLKMQKEQLDKLEQDVKVITQKHNELVETVNELKTKVETYSNKINELEQRVHQLENASQS